MPVLAQTLRPSSMETESKIQIQNLDKQHDNRRLGRPIKKGFKITIMIITIMRSEQKLDNDMKPHDCLREQSRVCERKDAE